MADYKDPENTLIIDTSKGTVVIELRPDLAPKHVERIKALVREKFYDGIVFHRVIEGFMAQTGCPEGRGTGGSKLPNLKAEFNEEPHVRGVCSMARSTNPDSANSQFFICFGDATFLDRQYTAWGKVIEGMENVDKLARGEPPRAPDRMITVRVAADAAEANTLAPVRPFWPSSRRASPSRLPNPRGSRAPSRSAPDRRRKTAGSARSAAARG